MISISTHLSKKLYTTIIIIYIVFLITFLSVHFISGYNSSKQDLKAQADLKVSLLEENLANFYYTDKQINDILNSSIAFSFRSFDLDLTEGKEYVINKTFENNLMFDNFYIVNKTGDFEYTFGETDIDTYYLKQLNIENPVITNRLTSDTNRLFMVSRYNISYYLVYSFNEDVLNELYSKDFKSTYFYIQTANNDVLMTNYNEDDAIQWIGFEDEEGYTRSNKFFTYYRTIQLVDKEYTIITQTSLETIFYDNINKSIIGIVITILILLISLLLTARGIIYRLKKPLKQFINEIECFSEKDYVYFTSLQSPKSEFIELSIILTQFKKLFLYNKNIYENLIEDLKMKLQLAEESNRSKSLFLANMSHEMRTPLNSIIGYTQLTQKIGFENEEKVKEYFECINNSSEILLQKINDILDLSKIESNQFELNLKPSNLKSLIKEIYHILKIQAEKKGIDFSYYVDPQIPDLLEFDKTRLKQIIINLSSNAIKFTEFGFVKLEVELFGFSNDSVVLEYKISDSGCGIPKDKIDNIFIPFVQVDNNSNIGTGLGLTIARDLIRLMGGDITVTSKENVGSIFSFNTIFTVSNKIPFKSEVQNGFDNELFMEKIKDKKILIAEDNVINQIFIKELFAVFSKTDIEIASDGIEVIKMCNSKVYDLVLMDIQMPLMTGIEATKKLRTMEQYQKVPIVALTANAFSEQIKEYLELGMNDYLQKPIDMNRFKNVLMKNL